MIALLRRSSDDDGRFWREPGRFLWRWWPIALAVMALFSGADGRQNVHQKDVAVRILARQARPMKSSKLLTDFVKDLDKPRWNEAASRKFLAHMADPAFGRKPIYAWLVTNHDEVARLRHRLDRPGWDSIAQVMAADGVLGARGAAPNGNAVRRVWKRVCRDKAAAGGQSGR